MLLAHKNAVIYGAGGAVGSAVLLASDHAGIITGATINITCGEVVD